MPIIAIATKSSTSEKPVELLAIIKKNYSMTTVLVKVNLVSVESFTLVLIETVVPSSLT